MFTFHLNAHYILGTGSKVSFFIVKIQIITYQVQLYNIMILYLHIL